MAGAILDKTPLERLREEMERPPFNTWLAPLALDADEERREVLISFRRRPELCLDETGQVVHGGVLAAMIDIAGHATVAVWHGSPTPTVSLHVDYLAPAAGAEVRVRGKLRRLGHYMGRADIEVENGAALVALGRGTFSTRRSA